MGPLARPSHFLWAIQMCYIFTMSRARWRERSINLLCGDFAGSHEFPVRIHKQTVLGDSKVHCGCNSPA
jgi:hypothetical protein